MSRSTALIPWLPWLLLMSSCSVPPKPPSVDESRRRPANMAMAVELQACRSDLANSRTLTRESVRTAEASGLVADRLFHQQQQLARGAGGDASGQRNVLVTVLFAFGSAQVSVPEAEASRIVEETRNAPLIVLRGRTDGAIETPAESGMARRRAAAVEAWLLQSGVDRARIRTTWQPVGDHAADNSTPGGRHFNRRVEIEVYRAAPVLIAASSFAAATR